MSPPRAPTPLPSSGAAHWGHPSSCHPGGLRRWGVGANPSSGAAGRTDPMGAWGNSPPISPGKSLPGPDRFTRRDSPGHGWLVTQTLGCLPVGSWAGAEVPTEEPRESHSPPRRLQPPAAPPRGSGAPHAGPLSAFVGPSPPPRCSLSVGTMQSTHPSAIHTLAVNLGERLVPAWKPSQGPNKDKL